MTTAMNMSKRFIQLCVVSVLLTQAALVSAQQQSTTQEQSSSSNAASSLPPPKDARTRAKAHTDLGSLYFQSGQLIYALEELSLAAAIDPQYATAFSTRGLVLYYVKEFDSAEKDFKRALELEERNPDINNNYGWYLCQTGKPKEAIAYFERAYKNPVYQTPAVAYLNAGSCYIKTNELDLAEDALRKSLRLKPDNNPQALYHLANVSHKRGNPDAAKKHLTEAVRMVDPGPDMLWLMLRVERRLGNEADERSLAAQLRRKFPDSEEYQEFLKGNFE